MHKSWTLTKVLIILLVTCYTLLELTIITMAQNSTNQTLHNSYLTEPEETILPGVQLTVIPLSTNGLLLRNAQVSITCNGITIASSYGEQTTIIPIPTNGSIVCIVTGNDYGKTATSTITLTNKMLGETKVIKLTIPISIYYIPGIGLVPTYILAIILIVPIIIIAILTIITILLKPQHKPNNKKP